MKNARQTRDHECHWPDCTEQVKPAVWGCRKHWFMLPKELRDEIWRAYRPGQEGDQRPSRAYLDAARKVQAWIAARTTSKAEPASRASTSDVQSRLYQIALHYADRVATVIPWQKLVTDEFAERAAIREHVGGIPHHQAEWAALQDLVEHFDGLVSDPARATSLP